MEGQPPEGEWRHRIEGDVDCDPTVINTGGLRTDRQIKIRQLSIDSKEVAMAVPDADFWQPFQRCTCTAIARAGTALEIRTTAHAS